MRSSDIDREAEYELKLKELDKTLNEYNQLLVQLANAIAKVKKDPTLVDAEEMNRMADAIKQRSEKQERHSQRHNSQFRKSLEWFSQLIGVKE